MLCRRRGRPRQKKREQRKNRHPSCIERHQQKKRNYRRKRVQEKERVPCAADENDVARTAGKKTADKQDCNERPFKKVRRLRHDSALPRHEMRGGDKKAGNDDEPEPQERRLARRAREERIMPSEERDGFPADAERYAPLLERIEREADYFGDCHCFLF